MPTIKPSLVCHLSSYAVANMWQQLAFSFIHFSKIYMFYIIVFGNSPPLIYFRFFHFTLTFPTSFHNRTSWKSNRLLSRTNRWEIHTQMHNNSLHILLVDIPVFIFVHAGHPRGMACRPCQVALRHQINASSNKHFLVKITSDHRSSPLWTRRVMQITSKEYKTPFTS